MPRTRRARFLLFAVGCITFFVSERARASVDPPADDFGLLFDGFDDRLQLGTLDIGAGGNRGLTLELRFQAEDLCRLPGCDARLVSKATGEVEQDHYWTLGTLPVGADVRLLFRLKTDENTSTLVAASGNLTPGRWYHAAATYDGRRMRLYLDGVEVGSAPKSGSVATNPAAAVWVADNPPVAGSRPFAGLIDDVRLWSRALSTVEIRENRGRELTGNEPGLVAYLPLDEGMAQTALDRSPTRRHGWLGSSPGSDANDPAWFPADLPETIIGDPADAGTVPNEDPGLFRVRAAALAGARYVRAGATGLNDGSDWTNAYPQLPATLVRGTTYYVADGSYPGYTFDDAVLGTELIEVKKATGSDHGTDVGWQGAYGDGRAQFGTLTFSSSYYVLDGQVGGGPPTWTSGLGFYIFTHGKGIESRTAGVSHVTIRNVEIEGHGDDENTASNDLIYLIGAHSHWVFSRLYLHDAGRTHFLWRETTDSIIEYSYMARNESTPAQHAEAISAFGGTARNTVRYSMWEDCEGTGVIMVAGSGWDIYGNVIFWTGNPQYGDTGNGSIGGWSGHTLSNTRVHNNTVVNGRGVSSGIRFFTSGGGNSAVNNLFYDCENFNAGRSGFAGVTASHSLIATTSGTYAPAGPTDQVMAVSPSLFVGLSSHDYRLARATQAGSSLAPPFDRDLLDQARGADGVWDRGAHEFGAATLPTVSVRADDALASEPGADTGAFVVSRSGSTNVALTVNLMAGGTATSGQDYTPLPASVTILAGAASASVTLSPLDDALVEGSETVILTLAAGAGYAIGSPASATASIADNDVVAGTGLSGTYFDNMDFTVQKLTRTDATVNFNWGNGSPHPSVAVDTFSVRWKGQVQAQFTETYTFYTRSDDGVRLWVGGQLLIDKWVDQAPSEWSGTIALVAGQRYDLKLEFLENVGGALVELRWSSPSTPKQIIPTSALFPPGASLPVVSVVATDATASEPGTDKGNFTLSRSGSTGAALAVSVTWGGTATNGADYTLKPTTLTFPAGAASVAVSVVPANDALVEGTETVVLTVAAGASYQVGSPASATLTLLDDDTIGTGLGAVYYDSMDFTAPKLTRTDATVNFNWGNGSPHPSLAADTFSVRWTGRVQPQFTETYTFFTRSDDGVRLWVGGQLLIDKWVNQATTEWSGTIALVAGQRYDLKLEFFENVGGALVELRWSSPQTPKQIIPTSALFPPGP